MAGLFENKQVLTRIFIGIFVGLIAVSMLLYLVPQGPGAGAASTDTVLAAQAFHWFDPEAALREFHRILRPQGWVVLFWNTRDREDPFTRRYSEIVDRLPDSKRSEAVDFEPTNLTRGGLFKDAGARRFPNAQVLPPVNNEMQHCCIIRR